MPKFCSNGHQMEDSWPDCPYCLRTGFQRPGGREAIDKTRIEGAGLAETTVPAQAERKTVMLSTLQKSPVVGWLVAINGAHKGEDFRLRDGQNLIGSSAGMQVHLSDQTVSARHASIRHADGVFTLIDLDSTNGTFVNDGKTTVGRETLKDNDLLRLGDVSLKFKCL